MNPLLKKALTAVAVKEAFERVQEMRAPKPSFFQRIKPLALVGAIGGGVAYLFKSGRLKGLMGKSDSSYPPYPSATYSAPSASPSSAVAGSDDDEGTAK